MATETQTPIHTIRIGAIQASIWEQTSEKGNFLTVTCSRSYKDQSDEWKTSHSYQVRDLDALILPSEVQFFAKFWPLTPSY